MLPTPMETMFFGFEGVKDGCEREVQAEYLAGGDWTRCGSPPMTPGMWHHLFLMIVPFKREDTFPQRRWIA